MTKYSYVVEYYQKHGNLWITSVYPACPKLARKIKWIKDLWNPIRDTLPYPETIMSEDAGSNNVCSFILYARAKRSNYINYPIYSTLLNEIDMIRDIEYSK